MKSRTDNDSLLTQHLQIHVCVKTVNKNEELVDMECILTIVASMGLDEKDVGMPFIYSSSCISC